MDAERTLTAPLDASGGNGGRPEPPQARINPQDLDHWQASLKCTQDGHYDTAASLSRYHYVTGIPLVILSAVSASSIMTDAEILFGSSYSKLIASGLGLSVTVLAALQAFLGYEKRAAQHYNAGAEYGAIKREMDLKKDTCDGEWLVSLSGRWDALTKDSPIIPLRIWHRKKRQQAQSSALPGLPLSHRWRHTMSILLRGHLPSTQA